MLVSTLLALTVSTADPVPFLTFTRSATGIATTQIEIGVLPSTGPYHYWLRRVESGQGTATVHWADTHSCAVASDVIRQAIEVEPPGIHIPGVPISPDGSVVITLDGVQYSFESRAHYGDNVSSSLRFTSNVGTPLADFVEDSIGLLEECWSEAAPEALYPSPE